MPRDLDVNKLDFRNVGLGTWKVRVKIGLVYDFSDFRTLNKYIAEGRVGAADLLSPDGVNWVPIGEIPNLAEHFVRVYLAAEQAMAESTDEEEEEDGDVISDFGEDIPTHIVGMGGLDTIGAAAPAATRASGPVVTGLTPSGGQNPDAAPRFVDPFESLQARRRDRATGRPAVSRPGASPTPASRGGSAKALAAVSLVAAAGAALWYFWPAARTPPPAAPVVVAPPPATQAPATSPEETRKKLIAELEQGLPEVQDDGAAPDDWIDAEEQLIPVRPDNLPTTQVGGVVSAPVAAPVTTTAPVRSTVGYTGSSSAADHAAVGEDAISRGSWSEAVRAYRNALDADPGNPRYRERFGVALYRMGDLAGAVTELRAAATGGAVAAHKWLGRIAREEGDSAGALGHYNTYLKANPSDAEVRAEIASLQGG